MMGYMISGGIAGVIAATIVAHFSGGFGLLPMLAAVVAGIITRIAIDGVFDDD